MYFYAFRARKLYLVMPFLVIFMQCFLLSADEGGRGGFHWTPPPLATGQVVAYLGRGAIWHAPFSADKLLAHVLLKYLSLGNLQNTIKLKMFCVPVAYLWGCSLLATQQKYPWFSAFPNFIKVGKFATSIERPKAKSVSASGGGLPPPDPRYRLTLSLAMPPPLQNPKYATGARYNDFSGLYIRQRVCLWRLAFSLSILMLVFFYLRFVCHYFLHAPWQ